MPMSALLRVRELKRVFGSVSDSNFEALIARLSVLYEDLRIELYGIADESIASLDQLDRRYRLIYFLRKSVATLSEFAESVRLLEACPEFVLITSEFSPEIYARWRKASEFFARKERFLKLIRNDIGGHFGLQAARFATQNLQSEAVNGIEMSKPFTRQGRVLLNFAGEIVATAMLRHARGLDNEHKFKTLVRVARLGYSRATTCVHCIAFYYLWEKFGKLPGSHRVDLRTVSEADVDLPTDYVL